MWHRPALMNAVADALFGVAVLLYRFREGDANMRSVWLCTRNDVIANIAVLVAAAGVLGTGTVWPDVMVAAMLAVLGLSSGTSVIRHARANRPRPRPRLLVGDERHRRDRIGPMARFALLLEDRRDVLRERRRRLRARDGGKRQQHRARAK